jgi:hypothetical protein
VPQKIPGQHQQERFGAASISTQHLDDDDDEENATMTTTAIKEHMDVIASDGQKVGQVDHMEGSDKVKLAKHDAPDGKHHLIPLNWVSRVDKHVHLNKAAKDVHAQWSETA